MVSLQWLEPSVFLFGTHQKLCSEVSPWLVVSVVDDIRWAFLIHQLLMKSDVCFRGFIVGCGPSGVCF